MQQQAEAGFNYATGDYWYGTDNAANCGDIGSSWAPLGGNLIYAVAISVAHGGSGLAEPVGIRCVNSYVQPKLFYCPGTEGSFSPLQGGTPMDPQGVWYYPWERPQPLPETYVDNFGFQPVNQGTWAHAALLESRQMCPRSSQSNISTAPGQYYSENNYQQNVDNPFGGFDSRAVLMPPAAPWSTVAARVPGLGFESGHVQVHGRQQPPLGLQHHHRSPSSWPTAASGKTWRWMTARPPPTSSRRGWRFMTDWMDGGAYNGPPAAARCRLFQHARLLRRPVRLLVSPDALLLDVPRSPGPPVPEYRLTRFAMLCQRRPAASSAHGLGF